MKNKNNKNNKNKTSVFPVLKRLYKYLAEYKGSIVLIIFGFIISTILGLMPAFLLKTALDKYLQPGKSIYLWYIAFGMLGAGILQGGMDFIIRFIAESRGQKVVYRIRKNVYNHILELPFSYFDNSQIGDIMSRITADADTLQSFLGFASIQIIGNILFIIGVLIVLFVWSVELALLYIFILPFVVLGITRYAFKVRPAYGKSRKILGELTTFIQENLSGIQIMKIFNNEKQTEKKFEKTNDKFFKINLEAGKITSFWMPYVFVLIGISTGLILWFGGMNVINGSITIGILTGFITYMGMMMRPVRQTGMLINRVMMASAAAERIFEVLDTKSDIKNMASAKDILNVKGDVEYKDVSFSYKKGKEILNDINFKVEAGKTVALVGPSGAGKTTLVHLLPRFYDVDKGEIVIDSIPIKHFTLESLRKRIGIMLQNTFIFNLSIRENISFGKPQTSMDEIVDAAKAAEIHDFIMSLPNKYNTITGEKGTKLSGGQKQRISIARTMLLNPDILILDEPTSSVDSRTDEKIQKAVHNLCKNRTVFMIAHRLWTLKNADQILVIDDGKIVQNGSHDELINKPGLYKDIYTLQVSGEEYDIYNGKEEE